MLTIYTISTLKKLQKNQNMFLYFVKDIQLNKGQPYCPDLNVLLKYS